MIVEEAKKGVKIFSIFMIIGLVIFLVGVAVSVKFIFFYPANKASTEAVITNITGNATSVSYEVNGRVYNKNYSVYSSNYYVGKKVKVLYNKAHPNKSMISSFRFMSLIGPGIGIIFLAISGVGLLSIYFKYYRI